MLHDTPPPVKVQHVAKDKQQSIQLLEAAVALLKEKIEDGKPVEVVLKVRSYPAQSKKIFIVHGHDNEGKRL